MQTIQCPGALLNCNGPANTQCTKRQSAVPNTAKNGSFGSQSCGTCNTEAATNNQTASCVNVVGCNQVGNLCVAAAGQGAVIQWPVLQTFNCGS